MGRPKKKKTVSIPLEDYQELNPPKPEVFEAPKEWEPYKQEEWSYVFKRLTYPPQVIRVLTHQSAQQYFKDSTQTEHNKLSVVQADELVSSTSRDNAESFGRALMKEAHHPEGFIQGVKDRSLNTLAGLYDGMKAVSLVIGATEQGKKYTTISITIACSDGPYEATITLLQGEI